MDAWVVDILRAYGLAGAVIGCLVAVAIAQSRTIAGMRSTLSSPG